MSQGEILEFIMLWRAIKDISLNIEMEHEIKWRWTGNTPPKAHTEFNLMERSTESNWVQYGGKKQSPSAIFLHGLCCTSGSSQLIIESVETIDCIPRVGIGVHIYAHRWHASLP
jgi:hypothetical protein